jgi:protein-S-isoprenylcysteine O-methyltransferase Ste14
MTRIGTETSQTIDGTPKSTRPAAARLRAAMIMVMLIALPSLVYYIWICLAFNRGQLAMPSAALLHDIPMPTPISVGILAGWLIFQGLLQKCAPGQWTRGAPLADETHLNYRMNGWFTWWFSWAAIAGGMVLHLFPPAVLADQFGPLLTTTNIFAYLLGIYLYRHGKAFGTTHERRSGNAVCDFWLGTALNPRIGTFDLKLFCEARPGLIGWVAIDLSLAAKQYQLHGTVTVPMILVCVFHFWYVADYFYHEEAILTTWDIRHENFGWMLCWGDLVWVPFTYTIQAYYLVDHTHDLPWWAAAGIVLLNLAGYIIFRGANNQKYRFRRDPAAPIWGKPARSIETARGSLLLASGWWGLARHMNYFGDLLMGLAWCLPCGFGSPLPYFYILYFTALLVHRERRDYRLCAARYGKDWERYCERVPYRIMPGTY